jgi:hypothetical protein
MKSPTIHINNSNSVIFLCLIFVLISCVGIFYFFKSVIGIDTNLTYFLYTISSLFCSSILIALLYFFLNLYIIEIETTEFTMIQERKKFNKLNLECEYLKCIKLIKESTILKKQGYDIFIFLFFQNLNNKPNAKNQNELLKSLHIKKMIAFFMTNCENDIKEEIALLENNKQIKPIISEIQQDFAVMNKIAFFD